MGISHYKPTILGVPPFLESLLWICPVWHPQTAFQDDSWGGAIELSILAEHFQCEIAAYDARRAFFMLGGSHPPRPKPLRWAELGVVHPVLCGSENEGTPKSSSHPFRKKTIQRLGVPPWPILQRWVKPLPDHRFEATFLGRPTWDPYP